MSICDPLPRLQLLSHSLSLLLLALSLSGYSSRYTAVSAERIRIGESAKRLGRDTDLNIERVLLENPLLQQMPMFSALADQTKFYSKKGDYLAKSIFPEDLHRTSKYEPADDNFDDEYKKINESLFDRAVAETDATTGATRSTLVPMPTGRSLADIEDDQKHGRKEGEEEATRPTTTRENEITEDNPPFAVTESLIDALQTVSIFTDATTPQITDLTLQTGNDAEEFLLTTPQPRTTKSRGLSKAKFQGVTYQSPQFDALNALGRVDENRVDVDRDHYIVAGTKIYVDNRVDGSHLSREEMPFEELPPTDPFAIEREIRHKVKAHGIRSESLDELAERSINDGEVKRERKEQHKLALMKSMKIRKIAEEPEMPSKARMQMNSDGRKVEHRETLIAGKMVTVELANPALHGHDLIAKPGAVVNGDLVIESETGINTTTGKRASKTHGTLTEIHSPDNPSETLVPFSQNSILIDSDKKELIVPHLTMDEELDEDMMEQMRRAQVLDGDTERITVTVTPTKTTVERLAESCFKYKPQSLLIGVDSIERRTEVSHLDCLRMCASSLKDCRSVVYHDFFSVCDLFNVKSGMGEAETKPAKGKYYYEPKKGVISCIDDFFRKVRGIKTPDEEEKPRRLKIVERDSKLAEKTIISSTRKRFIASGFCQSNEQPVFARSTAMRNPSPKKTDLVVRLNEDDCVFLCLRNMSLDTGSYSCATAQFDSFMQQCILAPSSPSHSLIRSITSNFYEKLCVSVDAARRCSGGVVDRRSQQILLGYLRDARTMPSAQACLDTCIRASVNYGFQCYSVMYYYEEESLNCILNDASALTAPGSMKREDEILVDYFGIDECFGMKEAASKTKSNQGVIQEQTPTDSSQGSSFRADQLARMLKLRRRAMRMRMKMIRR